MIKLNVIYKSYSIVENDADSNMPRPDTRQCKYCLSCFSSRDDIIMTSCALSIIEKNQLWPTKKSQSINCGSPKGIDILSQSSNCNQEVLVFFRQVPNFYSLHSIIFHSPQRRRESIVTLRSSLDCTTADSLFNHMST